MSDLILKIINDFLKDSRNCLDVILDELSTFNENKREEITLSMIHKGKKTEKRFEGNHFFLRTSIEYSSPQLTLEEVQGIIAARLLETCGNYLNDRKNINLEQEDFLKISEELRKPPKGKIIPFLLITDDIEPDRYSNNPLRTSILESGQSAFPVATVKTSNLKIDTNFTSKYKDSLISQDEADFIETHVNDMERYVDFIDYVKNDSLEKLSEKLEINLNLPIMRMPLELLMNEKLDDPLHLIIQGSHKDRDTVEAIYRLMGRSIKKKRTLLTIPHSNKGFGSKRAADGRLIFDGDKFKQINVKYRTIKLYPNMIDPDDLSTAKADDSLIIDATDFTNYNFLKTPSSPQFCLYIVLSPENASISHGVGFYSGSEISKSYCSMCEAYTRNHILQEVPRTNICKKPPIALNLVPENMWLHPKYKNLDTSIGCFDNLSHLLEMGMAIKPLDLKLEIDHKEKNLTSN